MEEADLEVDPVEHGAMPVAPPDPIEPLADRQALEAFEVDNDDLETLEGLLQQFNVFEVGGVATGACSVVGSLLLGLLSQ